MIVGRKPDTVRVLHVVGGMNRAGTETMLMHLFRTTDRSKVQFDFLYHTTDHCDYDDEIRALGGRIFRIPAPQSLLTANRYCHHLARILEENHFVVVHSHVLCFSGIVSCVAHRVGVPVRIAHSHSTGDKKGRLAWVRWVYGQTMRCLIRRYSTTFIACSRSAADFLFGEDCDTIIVPNAINLEEYRELPGKSVLRRQLGLPEDALLVGHVGRFEPPKNHTFLIELFATLLRVQPSAYLVLVGDGRDRHSVEEMVTQKGLVNSVRFLGVRSDVPRIMAALDVFVLPSLFEGLSLVSIEAQAAGVPCLVSKGVPRDADMGLGLMDFLPLNAPLDSWADSLLILAKKQACGFDERAAAINSRGYSLSKTSAFLQSVYLGAVGGEL